jgi:hypothetical protein
MPFSLFFYIAHFYAELFTATCALLKQLRVWRDLPAKTREGQLGPLSKPVSIGD